MSSRCLFQLAFWQDDAPLSGFGLRMISGHHYTYDNLGRVTAETQTIDGLSSTIEYDSQYDAAGNRTDLQALLGTTSDFHNTYAYDNLRRLISLVQAGVSGGDAVAEKRIDFGYNANSQFNSISRYADTAGSELVANTFYGYDDLGRLMSLFHTTDAGAPTSAPTNWGTGILAGYLYGFDAGSRITSLTSYWDGATSYSYDNTSQLTGADHDTSGPADESYSYDENGNRTMSGYSTGDNNQLTSNGTSNYAYDAEGNRLTRVPIGTGQHTEYAWDWRNRLTGVTEKDSSGNVLSTVAYAYDINNRRILKSVDSDGPGSAAAVDTYFSWEHDQIALQFDGGTAADLSHRYLDGPAVDQLLADEAVSSLSSAGSVLWPLADHLGTVADLATHNSSTHATTIANHRTFDSYGNITAETNSTVDTVIAFTGRERDAETGLQYNRARYYDAAIGRWLSEDPIQFSGDHSNIIRYAGNTPLSYADPRGLDGPPGTGIYGPQWPKPRQQPKPCGCRVLIWEVDAFDNKGNLMDFESVVETARKRGEFDVEIPVTRDESPRDVLTKVGEVVDGGIISDIRILDHGNVGPQGTGTLGQSIGGGYINPADFGVLKPKLKPGGRIRLDGCTLGASRYDDYRREISDITGQRVEASPDLNIIIPTEDSGGFESRSRTNSTTVTF